MMTTKPSATVRRRAVAERCTAKKKSSGARRQRKVPPRAQTSTSFRQIDPILKDMSLAIVEVGNPVLHRVARTLSPEEIRSAEIQKLIGQMRETMHEAP